MNNKHIVSATQTRGITHTYLRADRANRAKSPPPPVQAHFDADELQRMLEAAGWTPQKEINRLVKLMESEDISPNSVMEAIKLLQHMRLNALRFSGILAEVRASETLHRGTDDATDDEIGRTLDAIQQPLLTQESINGQESGTTPDGAIEAEYE